MASCNICRSSLISSDQIISPKCGHVFHKDCLDRSLQHNKTCPNCRGSCEVSSDLRRLYLDFHDNPKLNDTKAPTMHEIVQKMDLVKRRLEFTDKEHDTLEKNVKITQEQLTKFKDHADELENTIEDITKKLKEYKKSKFYNEEHLEVLSKTMVLLLRILVFLITITFFVTMYILWIRFKSINV